MTQARQEISRTDIVAWSGKQLASEIDDEVVLMNIEMGKYYSLDDIGSKIWRALEKPTPVETMAFIKKLWRKRSPNLPGSVHRMKNCRLRKSSCKRMCIVRNRLSIFLCSGLCMKI